MPGRRGEAGRTRAARACSGTATSLKADLPRLRNLPRNLPPSRLPPTGGGPQDLAEGHVSAVVKVLNTPDLRCTPINLGTGKGEAGQGQGAGSLQGGGRARTRQCARRYSQVLPTQPAATLGTQRLTWVHQLAA